MNHHVHYPRIVKTAVIFLLTLIFFNVNAYTQDQDGQALQLVKTNMKEIGLSQNDLDNLYVSDVYTDKISGATIVYLQQQYKAISIRNALYTLAFKNGKVVSATNTFVKKLEAKVVNDIPAVSPLQAVNISAQHLKLTPVDALEIKPAVIMDPKMAREKGKKYVEFKKNSISKKDIPVKLIWVYSGDSSLNLAWEVHIDPLNKPDMWDVSVDAIKGVVLEKSNWTKECRWDEPFIQATCLSAIGGVSKETMAPWVKNVMANKANFGPGSINSLPLTQNSQYLVIPYPFESPLYTNGKQSIHENPWLLAGANNPAVSFGWHFDGTNDYTYTRGNNVLAQEDKDNNNTTPGYPAPSATPLPNLKFQYVLDSSSQPGSTNNLMAAITNTFYWCNIMHDISYQYGFDEAAGNFQRNNMGRGGLENDYVQAEAQDGSGLNNANFASPPDGENPRMQMYIFNPIIQFNVNSPASIARTYSFTEIAASPNSILRITGSKSGNVVLYNDNLIGSTHLACGAASNNGAINGNIALIDRGNCALTIKIKNAQNAGAIAVIIVDNATGVVGNADTSIRIPSILISQVDGIAIKNELRRNPVNVTIQVSSNLDGDLDNGIIAHEYTHGISTRLTGGPKTSSCLSTVESAGMGEGWSDYYSLMVTTDWSMASITDGTKRRPVGNYALGQPVSGSGVRAYPYSTNMGIDPLTYSNLSQSGGEVHNIGTIWCTALWDVTWAIIAHDGIINTNLYNANGEGGNSAALKLVTLGLKLQPCNPGFLDARNAILKADSILFSGKYSCVIWNAFARRGMGVNATQGSSESYLDQVAGFNIPDGAIIRTSVDRHAAGTGEIVHYTFAVKCQCAALTGLTIRDSLPANIQYQSGGILNGNVLTFSPIDVDEQQTAFFNATVKIKDSYTPPINFLNETVASTTLNPALWTRTSISGTSQWSITHGKAHSLLYAFNAPDSSKSADFTLTSTLSYPISRLATLSFWHHYDTELSWDGGVVELSTNNGATWIDAGPYMTDNKYPSSIYSGSGTSIAGRGAFTGFSGASMIQTNIDLSSFSGQSIKFRFRFVSDVVVGALGWFVDDILLRTEAGVFNSAGLFIDTSLLSKSSSRTLISGQPPLTVLSEFDVAALNDNTLISWQTTNDFDLQLFEVERSLDGINFEVIGKLQSATSGNTANNYQLLDDHPVNGTNYYRLKQIDFNGKIVYSEIKSVEFGKMDLELVVKPNPSTGLITVTLPAANSISLNVYDTKGNMVQRKNLVGSNQKIDLSNFAKGVYILHFKIKDQTVIRKLVIQ